MESSLGPLFPLLERERAAGRALALAVLVHTAGSTYRKPGALLLIAQSGEYAGLLSGGCLEGDLAQRAREVIETGRARFVTYDLRDERDLVWGLGRGCEGEMRILLLRTGPEEHWEPLAHLASALAAHSPAAVGIVTESADAELPIGALVLPGPASPQPRPQSLPGRVKTRLTGPSVAAALESARRTAAVGWFEESSPDWKLFLLPLSLPPRLLLLGAGPDALPVADLAARQHWKVTLVDHRPAYAQPSHFPLAERVLLSRPEALAHAVHLADFSAAVVMSHHLPSDLEYLRALAANPTPRYVGLLGPPARRDKLLGELGPQAKTLSGRLWAPVGFDLGGRTPESIALAIVAEVHAFLCGTAQREKRILP